MCNHHYYAYACGHDGPLIYSYCGHHEDQQSPGRLPIDGPFGIMGSAHYCREGYVGKTTAPDHSHAQAQRRRTPDCCSSHCRERVEAEQGRWEEAKARWIEDHRRYEEASWEWANDAGRLESARRQWEADWRHYEDQRLQWEDIEEAAGTSKDAKRQQEAAEQRWERDQARYDDARLQWDDLPERWKVAQEQYEEAKQRWEEAKERHEEERKSLYRERTEDE